MSDNPNFKQIKEFFNLHQDVTLFSTKAEVINYGDVVYNVDGSSDDPKIDGAHWKGLLEAHGISEPCYVTNKDGPGKSHPDGWIGGHMADNAEGHVPDGGVCYLMPLCSWHNHTARNGVPFTHTETKMLKLSGYMQSETAFTFSLRLPSEEPFRIAHYYENNWHVEDVDKKKMGDTPARILTDQKAGTDTHSIVLERIADGYRVISLVGLTDD